MPRESFDHEMPCEGETEVGRSRPGLEVGKKKPAILRHPRLAKTLLDGAHKTGYQPKPTDISHGADGKTGVKTE